MENVLKDFVDHMENIAQHIDSYAVSCADAGWGRRGDTHKGHLYTDHSVADVMKCRLMVAALYFVTGWSNHMTHDKDPSENDKDMKAIMRCMVANVFAYILAAIKCGFQWPGVDRAWTIMKELVGSSGDPSNPISRGTCTLDVYKDTNIGTGDLQGAIQNWLKTRSYIRDSITQIEKNPKCKMQWEMYKKSFEARGEDADLSSIFQQDDMNTLVKTQVTKMFRTITNTVRKKVDKARNNTRSSGGVGDSDVESEDEEEEEPKKSTIPKESQLNGKSRATKPAVPTTGGAQQDSKKDTRSDEDNTHGAAGAGGDGKGPGQGPGPGQQPPPAPPEQTQADGKAQDLHDATATGATGTEGKELTRHRPGPSTKRGPQGSPENCEDRGPDQEEVYKCILRTMPEQVNQVDDSKEYGPGVWVLPESARSIEVSKGASPDAPSVPTGKENVSKADEKTTVENTPPTGPDPVQRSEPSSPSTPGSPDAPDVGTKTTGREPPDGKANPDAQNGHVQPNEDKGGKSITQTDSEKVTSIGQQDPSGGTGTSDGGISTTVTCLPGITDTTCNIVNGASTPSNDNSSTPTGGVSSAGGAPPNPVSGTASGSPAPSTPDGADKKNKPPQDSPDLDLNTPGAAATGNPGGSHGPAFKTLNSEPYHAEMLQSSNLTILNLAIMEP
ncbi:hypothetical protein AK88_03338 [Plasmodium fragile]|uniref:Uncharacterized protein n=1 Tax=Plasmodium fragile TaxID=5857 RepID=A0A0D9QJR3_PLAFR|nr:uncharacterized protein AK88_03338 [Plasmodium fragile]KJP87052.1 hypothetical protein AK88_03338 [Plasmodium fragile]